MLISGLSDGNSQAGGDEGDFAVIFFNNYEG